MTQIVISQRIQKTCEGCGKVAEFEFIGMNEKTVEEIMEWRVVVREVLIDGQFQKVMVQACSQKCLVPADSKIVIQREEQTVDEIDLESLRARSTPPVYEN